MAIKLTTPVNSIQEFNLPRASAQVITQNAVYTLVNNVLVLYGGAQTDNDTTLFIANASLPVTDTTTTSVNCTMIPRMRDTYTCDVVSAVVAGTQVGDRYFLDATGLLINNTGTDAPLGSFQVLAVLSAAATGTTNGLAIAIRV